MKRLLILLFSILIFAVPSFAAEPDFDQLFAKLEAAQKTCGKGLNNYVCDVDTSHFDVMMKRMTSSMPEDLPRPPRPELKKYWDRKRGTVVRVEGKNVFPYMREFSQKMSTQFALELNCYFLPQEVKAKRDAVMKTAERKIEFANEMYRFTITFPKKTDIDGLFFRGGLPTPTDDVKSIRISADEKSLLIKELSLEYDRDKGVKTYKLLAEYMKTDGHELMRDIYMLSDDTSIMANFKTEFAKTGGFYLPVRQTRTSDGPDVPEENKRITVEFKNYKLNTKLPAGVFPATKTVK